MKILAVIIKNNLHFPYKQAETMGFLYEMPNVSAFREVDLKKRPCKMDIRGRKDLSSVL